MSEEGVYGRVVSEGVVWARGVYERGGIWARGQLWGRVRSRQIPRFVGVCGGRARVRVSGVSVGTRVSQPGAVVRPRSVLACLRRNDDAGARNRHTHGVYLVAHGGQPTVELGVQDALVGRVPAACVRGATGGHGLGLLFCFFTRYMWRGMAGEGGYGGVCGGGGRRMAGCRGAPWRGRPGLGRRDE